MDAETTGIVISSGAVGALCGVASALIKAKCGQRSIIKPEPSPFPVEGEIAKKPQYVTVGECNRRMCEMQGIVDNIRTEIKDGNRAILSAIAQNDDKSENRAVALNRRIDPMMEKMAECRGQVDLIKDHITSAWKSSTIGGKK